MKPSSPTHKKAEPPLTVLAESELNRSGFRLAFPQALEARYSLDLAAERLRESRFIALSGVALYFCFGVLLNLTTIRGGDWKDIAIQLLGATATVLAIVHVGLRERVGFAMREWALMAAGLVCSLAAILVIAGKPTPATLRDFLQAIPPACFVLVFVRLRFHQAAVFVLANIGTFALTLSMRPEIGQTDTMFLIGFVMTLLLPALLGGHAFERVSRRIYLHQLLERLRNENLTAENLTLTDLSYTDPLTNVANRRRLDEALAELVTAPESVGALLLIDIDTFKVFNDRYGHLAGDECLCHVARCLSSHLRSVDLLARFGGEEFAVVLPQATIEQATVTAERLCQAVHSRPFAIGNLQVQISVSIGIASREGLDTPEALIGSADTALYAAKHAGRNRVHVASAGMAIPERLSA